MGWAKYTEDIRRDVEINLSKVTPAHFIPKNIYEDIIECFYCHEVFKSYADLFSHMRKEHNTLQAVLQLNNRVLEPGSYIETDINSLHILPVQNKVTFSLNGNNYEVTADKQYIDLIKYGIECYNELNVVVDNREWTIHKNKHCNVTTRVNVTIDSLNKSVINRQRPDLEALMHQIKNEKIDIRDAQYIYGFYEYSLACLVNEDNKDKDNLYYSAFNKFLPYIQTDARARLLVKIICLRYLWIDKLNELCKGYKPNDFSVVCAFFDKKQIKANTNNIGRTDNIFEVFVEDAEYDNTREIVNYMNGDYNAVKRYLGKHIKLAEENNFNLNLRDKIFMLQARLYEKEGNYTGADYYFSRIYNQHLLERMVHYDV